MLLFLVHIYHEHTIEDIVLRVFDVEFHFAIDFGHDSTRCVMEDAGMERLCSWRTAMSGG